MKIESTVVYRKRAGRVDRWSTPTMRTGSMGETVRDAEVCYYCGYHVCAGTTPHCRVRVYTNAAHSTPLPTEPLAPECKGNSTGASSRLDDIDDVGTLAEALRQRLPGWVWTVVDEGRAWAYVRGYDPNETRPECRGTDVTMSPTCEGVWAGDRELNKNIDAWVESLLARGAPPDVDAMNVFQLRDHLNKVAPAKKGWGVVCVSGKTPYVYDVAQRGCRTRVKRWRGIDRWHVTKTACPTVPLTQWLAERTALRLDPQDYAAADKGLEHLNDALHYTAPKPGPWVYPPPNTEYIDAMDEPTLYTYLTAARPGDEWLRWLDGSGIKSEDWDRRLVKSLTSGRWCVVGSVGGHDYLYGWLLERWREEEGAHE